MNGLHVQIVSAAICRCQCTIGCDFDAGDIFGRDLNQREGVFGVLFGCAANVGCVLRLRLATTVRGCLQGESAGDRRLCLITLCFNRVGPKLFEVVCSQAPC